MKLILTIREDRKPVSSQWTLVRVAVTFLVGISIDSPTSAWNSCMEVAKETPTISKLEKSVRSHVLLALDHQTDRTRMCVS